MSAIELIPSTETGKLQVMHLKRYWSKSLLKRAGELQPSDLRDEWKKDSTLLNLLGVGLEQTMQYVYHQAPTFDEFENWILTVSGEPDADKVNRFNQLIKGDKNSVKIDDGQPKLLTADDLDFWQQNGYFIIKNAVSKECCDEAIEVLCEFIGVDRYDASTWYNTHPERKGIMVQLFQHPVLDQNRNAYKIRKAYDELWDRTDLWVSTDRVGFNPPETERHTFQGPYLHWDVSLKLPIPFGLQGLLYLADTAENQGAFTLIPGFQNRIDDWMKSLPEGNNPRDRKALYELGPKAIAANAGDFIIWHQALPHGSSPNTSTLPRFVQYINYAPLDEVESDVWI